jgi:hypothetical protein
MVTFLLCSLIKCNITISQLALYHSSLFAWGIALDYGLDDQVFES